jgi:hypothetical protein
LNEDDRENVIRSIPAATRASADEKFTAAVAAGSIPSPKAPSRFGR